MLLTIDIGNTNLTLGLYQGYRAWPTLAPGDRTRPHAG